MTSENVLADPNTEALTNKGTLQVIHYTGYNYNTNNGTLG